MPVTVNTSLLEKASILIKAGGFEDARAVLEEFRQQTLPMAPTDQDLDFWRRAGEEYRDAGMPEAAEEAWRRAQQTGIVSHAVETEIICGYMLAGRFEEISERLGVLRSEHPKNAVVHNLHAIMLFESGEHQKALAEWESCRQISAQLDCPLSTHPLYLSLGAMAIERYLLEQNPVIQSSQGGNIISPEKATGRSHGKRMEQIERAWDEGRYAQALSWIDGEMIETGASTESRMVRALILGGLARWDEARREVIAALQENPNNPAAQSYLAYTLIHSSEPGVALALLDRIEPAGPDDFFANYIRGCGWIALGDRLRAAQAFRVAFTEYFFDSYHSVLVPAWKRVLLLLGAHGQDAHATA